MLISSPTIPEVVFERIKSDVSDFAFNFFQDGQQYDVASKIYKFRLKASGIQVLEKSPVTNAAGRVAFSLSTADKTPLVFSEYSLSLIEVLAGGGERTIVTGTLRWSVPSGKNIGLVTAPDVSVNYITATGSLMVALGVVDFGSSSSALSAAAAKGYAELTGELKLQTDQVKADTLAIKDSTAQLKLAVDQTAVQVETKKSEIISAAAAVEADRILVQQAVADAQATYEEKGDWNASTNIPALTANATIGQTSPEKPQRYVITVGGNLPFAIKDQLQGSAIGKGYLIQHPTGVWYYDSSETPALDKVTVVESAIFPKQTIGVANLTAPTRVNTLNRFVINQNKPSTIVGVAKTLNITTVTNPGNVKLIQLRKNLAAGKYLEVSRNTVATVVGLNAVDISAFNIGVLVGDVFGVQVAQSGVDIGSNATGTGLYAYTPATNNTLIEVLIADVEGSSANGQICFNVYVDDNYLTKTAAKIAATDANVATNSANITALTNNLTATNITVNDLSASLIATENVVVENVPGENQSTWNVTTFSGWAFGYLPTSLTRLNKISLILGQVNQNAKLVLRIYTRPVTDVGLTDFPGLGPNDVLLQTIEVLTSTLSNTTNLQTVNFSFAEIAADTSHIYIFSVKGVTAGNLVGALGSDRATIVPNILPQYARGWYNVVAPGGAGAAVASTSTFRVSHTVEAKVVFNKVDNIRDSVAVHTTSLSSITGSLAKLAKKSFGKGTKLYENALAAISAGWTAVNWGVASGGLAPTATGLANFLRFDTQYSASKRKARVTVTLGTTTRFMIFTRPVETNSNLGTIVECDVAAGKIRIYVAYKDDNVLPAIQVEKVYPFVAGRNYIVELIKNDFDNEIRVIDEVTGLWDSLVDSSNLSGRQHDSYAMCCYSGTFPIVKKFQVSTPYETGCLVYPIGDSIDEARYTPLAPGDGHAYKLVAALNGNGGVSGRGGGTIDGVIRRIESEIAFIRPTYVPVKIGTNAGNTAEKLIQVVTRLIELGCIPILHNIPRRASGSDVATNVTLNDVRTAYGLSGCRFELATSIGNIVANGQDQSLFISDSGQWVHPNAAGQLAMFNRYKIDLPELLINI